MRRMRTLSLGQGAIENVQKQIFVERRIDRYRKVAPGLTETAAKEAVAFAFEYDILIGAAEFDRLAGLKP